MRVVVPGVLVLGALLCTVGAIMSRPKANKAGAEAVVTRVEVIPVRTGAATARLNATGVVEASRRVVILPEVTGRVIWTSDSAVPGGRLDAGETFARIDSRDYSLRVEQARATVHQAEVELQLEKGRGDVAQREWALLRSDRAASDAPLALRAPQLASAKQGLAGAEASLKQAEIALSRTRFSAPFNALVLEESIEVGQVVAPGTPLATLIGTDRFWVSVGLPVDELGAVILPSKAAPGSAAIVRQNLGSGTSVVRRGHVEQLRAQLDPQTRTAQLIVGIDNPLEAADGELPLLPGAYVDVVLEGRELSDVVRMPRTALHQGSHVWVVDETGGNPLLRDRTVEVGWKEGDDVLITAGLQPTDRIVVSPISIPVDGMPVEVMNAGAEEAGRE